MGCFTFKTVCKSFWPKNSFGVKHFLFGFKLSIAFYDTHIEFLPKKLFLLISALLAIF